MYQETFRQHHTWDGPAVDGHPVTPNDGADLPNGPTRALRVAGAGPVAVIFNKGTTSVVIPAVTAGETLHYSVRRVLATGTTATGIMALY